MISVVIPTLNAERGLAACLGALVPAAAEGLVREVIIADGGSGDRTLHIVDQAGATLIRTAAGRGAQLAAGAERARMPWLLFLHADTVLEPGWEHEVSVLLQRMEQGERPHAAAAFSFALDDLGFKPRLWELGVALRCTLLRLPYGDQGLLIPARLYRSVGGYRPMRLMEDVDLVRRIGRARIVILRARAVTSALRYQREGYLRRTMRNLACRLLYRLRVPHRVIERLYG